MTNFSSPHWTALTPEEQQDLMLAYDGTIPEQAMIDKLNRRPVRDAAWLREQIKIKQSAQAADEGYRATLNPERDKFMYGTTTNVIVARERQIAQLRSELGALEASNV